MKKALPLLVASLSICFSMDAGAALGLSGLGSTTQHPAYINYSSNLGGIQFQTGSQATRLDSIEFWGQVIFGTSTFTLTLYTEGTSSSYGSSVGVIGSQSVTALASNGGGLYTIAPTTNFELAANTKYWIGFTSSTGGGQMGVMRDGNGQPADYTMYGSDLGWTGTSARNIGAEANGKPAGYAMNVNVSVVPEPSAVALSVVAGSAFFLRRRR